ncbi:MAG: hypothetical protein ACREC5_05510 [Thermoplasmata archaeon]
MSAMHAGADPGPLRDRVPANPDGPDPFARRIAALLGVAAAVGTGVPLGELVVLLPLGRFPTADALRDWLADRPGLARIRDDWAYAPGAGPNGPDPGRLARGERYWTIARSIRDTTLRPILPLVLALGVTGSSAYGEPEEGDDLDLLAITRPGALWVFLAYAFVALRVGRSVSPEPGPRLVCLNFVRDATAIEREFATPHDFVYAREALSVRLLHGEAFYAGLLAEAGWMGEAIPRKYATRCRPSLRERVAPAPWAVRLLNLLIFPALAAYLQAQGLRRNAGYRREGRAGESFESITRLDRLSFRSDRFERQRAAFRALARAGAIERPEEGSGSRVPPIPEG